MHPFKYCKSISTYSRRETIEVKIGEVPLGGLHPIRVQSMTTADTMDTKATVEEAIRMIDAGSEYVRITTPSIKEAENLQSIKQELAKKGYSTPIIADIHFTPNAAECAARIVEKVRINPGNYADKKKFQVLEYTDESYNQEIERIRKKFIPLIKICKEYGTAMRIGTNHGSLSDRIMSRYGDTPEGMVESALEFLRICEDELYYNIVLSMKSSNPQVMVQAYRLLVHKLEAEKLKPYPLHLGVTEAGDGEDGRIKSAVGIGTLLEDGLGDTVRVSLTEPPENEIPVARALVNRYTQNNISAINEKEVPKSPFEYQRRKTNEIENIGLENVPRVIADFSKQKDVNPKDLKSIGHHYMPELDKWIMTDFGADYIYTGDNLLHFMLPNGLKEIANYETWANSEKKENIYPLLTEERLKQQVQLHPNLNFVAINAEEIEQLPRELYQGKKLVIILSGDSKTPMKKLRDALFYLYQQKITNPVIINLRYEGEESEKVQIYSSIDLGALLVDGFGDGVMLSKNAKNQPQEEMKFINQTAFGILQASRMRISKTEYISCPSCGRTLFDLEETTAMIRKRTDHLKGVKIGIMGCIVNGPGEMADADYGYVGSGKGKITLYKGKEVIKRAVPSEKAVDELIQIIKEDGNWIEPQKIPDTETVVARN